MMKSKNSALAILITERINEILEITGFSQTEFAIHCELEPRILKSYCCNSRSFTVESISKICTTFSVSLKDFFDFAVPLEINSGIIVTLHKRPVKETPEARRHRLHQERDCIWHMISNTSYFDAPIGLNQILKILRKEYGLLITDERVYEMLKRYVGMGTLTREYKIRTTKERESFQPKRHLYQKNSTG